MSDQSDNRFYRQRSSSSEHEIQRELRRQIAAEIEQQAHSRDDLMRLIRDGTITDWVAGWDAATLAAAEIARGRS